MAAKPKVFVGSASEASASVKTLCGILRRDQTATMIEWWNAPEFNRGSYSTLDSLMHAVETYDFAVFLFTPDDLYKSRGLKGKAPRDNVVFEYGLFLGALGPERAFAFVEHPRGDKKTRTKIPSDLYGINIPTFTASSDEHELIDSLSGAADTVRKAIADHPDWWHLHLDAIKSWKLDPQAATFHVTLNEKTLRQYPSKFWGKQLLLVLRKQDNTVSTMEDARTEFAETRPYSGLDSDPEILAKSTDVIGKALDGERIEAYLFTVPPDFAVKSKRTLSNIIEQGGRLAGAVGQTVRR